MCVTCNGGTIKDVFRILNLQIIDRGFAIVPVGTRTDNKGWAYTIGLIDSKPGGSSRGAGPHIALPGGGGKESTGGAGGLSLRGCWSPFVLPGLVFTRAALFVEDQEPVGGGTCPSTALIANNGEPAPVPDIGGSSNFL